MAEDIPKRNTASVAKIFFKTILVDKVENKKKNQSALFGLRENVAEKLA